ncbi:unnamed protein product [Ceratitis capitata]|uniref:(Mediterranean fruit fly) hypothetical protein n=1 Tax=Ceratitis capitata TaxID=7213 RepID=A0A811U9Z2_CERCA|nr:unnamed protein product [Ceratitis capitata]
MPPCHATLPYFIAAATLRSSKCTIFYFYLFFFFLINAVITIFIHFLQQTNFRYAGTTRRRRHNWRLAATDKRNATCTRPYRHTHTAGTANLQIHSICSSHQSQHLLT